jgi:hypothetical protein
MYRDFIFIIKFPVRQTVNNIATQDMRRARHKQQLNVIFELAGSRARFLSDL